MLIGTATRIEPARRRPTEAPLPSRSVNRRLRSLLFVLCLLWQPLSTLLPAALDARADAIGHAVVHDQAVGHHHHDDASLHLGETNEAPHQHVPDGSQSAALAVEVTVVELGTPATRVRTHMVAQPASAELEVLLRPPRAASCEVSTGSCVKQGAWT